MCVALPCEMNWTLFAFKLIYIDDVSMHKRFHLLSCRNDPKNATKSGGDREERQINLWLLNVAKHGLRSYMNHQC